MIVELHTASVHDFRARCELFAVSQREITRDTAAGVCARFHQSRSLWWTILNVTGAPISQASGLLIPPGLSGVRSYDTYYGLYDSPA